MSLRPWLELARISNLPTVWTNVLAGWILARGGADWVPLGGLLAGGSLIYTGGMLLNDVADVRFDREHRQDRPIPSGRVSLGAVAAVAVIFLVAGALLATLVGGASAGLTLALVLAVVVYDLYHKPWSGSVLVMGACRTLLYLVAGSAVTGAFRVADQWDLLIKAIALGGYVVGLSLVARHEATRGQPGKVWGVIGIVALEFPIVAILGGYLTMPERAQFTGWTLVVGILIVILFYLMLKRAWKWLKTPPPSNIGRAVGLFLAGIVWVDALAIFMVQPTLALGFVFLLPLLLLWQRKILAT